VPKGAWRKGARQRAREQRLDADYSDMRRPAPGPPVLVERENQIRVLRSKDARLEAARLETSRPTAWSLGGNLDRA
jgi:hypothetical protein